MELNDRILTTVLGDVHLHGNPTLLRGLFSGHDTQRWVAASEMARLIMQPLPAPWNRILFYPLTAAYFERATEARRYPIGLVPPTERTPYLSEVMAPFLTQRDPQYAAHLIWPQGTGERAPDPTELVPWLAQDMVEAEKKDDWSHKPTGHYRSSTQFYESLEDMHEALLSSARMGWLRAACPWWLLPLTQIQHHYPFGRLYFAQYLHHVEWTTSISPTVLDYDASWVDENAWLFPRVAEPDPNLVRWPDVWWHDGTIRRYRVPPKFYLRPTLTNAAGIQVEISSHQWWNYPPNGIDPDLGWFYLWGKQLRPMFGVGLFPELLCVNMRDPQSQTRYLQLLIQSLDRDKISTRDLKNAVGRIKKAYEKFLKQHGSATPPSYTLHSRYTNR